MATTDPVLTVSDKARQWIVALRDESDDAEADSLWVEVLDAQDGQFAYDVYLQGRRHADPGDAVIDHDDLTVVIPAASVPSLHGATLDMSRDLLHPGLRIEHPNSPAADPSSPQIDEGPLDLSGPLEERVETVLERRINPSIAGHGGRADLVSVEGGVVSLRLSGGCQGCGMAVATLRNGIEVRLREAIPEITEIVDLTDHTAGTDPYY